MRTSERHSILTAALAGCLALGVGACAPVGPDFVKPDLAAPPEWSTPLATELQAQAQTTAAWWLLFEDPLLDGLVQLARQHNNDLQVAGLRILEARARLGIATGTQYPQTQVAAGGATWISPPDNSGLGSDFWQYDLGATISWEVDFWGRFRRAIESADAAYLASIAAYRQAEVLLCAAVVDAYTVVRTTEEKLRIADENLRIQQRSYEIAEVLFRNGADSELDMQQARTLLLATKATRPALEAALRQARNALSTLLGESPGFVDSLLGSGRGIPELPGEFAIGFPADMLRQRPDVRRAELDAMALNAQVGLAEADLYPSFSLNGSIGLSSNSAADSDFGDLFSSDALGLSIGPSFIWPFLNYGRIKNNVRVQDARLQQGLLNYRETVLQAQREAEDAIAAYIGSRQQVDILKDTVDSARRSNEISTLRYQEGFSDYQRVLDAQQSLFTQQQRYVEIQGASVRNVVALYTALGGGWQTDLDRSYVAPETLQEMQQRTDWGNVIDAAWPNAEHRTADENADD